MLHSEMTDGTPTSPRSLRVNLVLKDRGWIVDKMSRRLVEHLPRWGVSAQISAEPLADADVNHWFYTDVDVARRVATRHTLFVTHVDRSSKAHLLKRHLEIADLAMCMSRMTVEQLAASGIDRRKLCFINPAHDGEVPKKRFVIGITSRVRQDKAKREDLLVRLAEVMPLDAFHFDIIGRGWETVIPALEAAGATVRYYPGTDDADADYKVNLERIPGFDYYLYLGLDEGSMGFLDALAAGVPTIVTAQGFHLDAHDGITFPFVTFEDMLAIFRHLADDRRHRLDAVASWTWDEYARLHAIAWRAVASGEDGTAISRRLQEGKTYPAAPPPLPIPTGWKVPGARFAVNTHVIREDIGILAQSYTYGTPMFRVVGWIGGLVRRVRRA